MPRIEEHRVPVVFDCPKCRAEGVAGTAYNLRETIRVSKHMPSWGWTSHWVRCSQCRAELHADCTPDDLYDASIATVTDSVCDYQPFANRCLAVAGLVLGWAPVFGVIVATASMAANLRTRGWPRVLSIVVLALTTIYNVVLFGTLIYWSALASRPLPL